MQPMRQQAMREAQQLARRRFTKLRSPRFRPLNPGRVRASEAPGRAGASPPVRPGVIRNRAVTRPTARKVM